MPSNLDAEWAQQELLDTTFIRAAPLPRLNPLPLPSSSDGKRYEVLVIGAGPSGLMLTTLLTRYGLPSTSILCIESRPHQTLIGNADGINARTLEILGQLGLNSSFRRDGNSTAEHAMWMREESNPDVLVRKISGELFFAPTRYEQFVCIHQGHVERVFRQDLMDYGANDVQYGSRLVAMKIDEDGDKEFPVLATIERGGSREEVRAKYLVGADGAKSAVRGFMGVEMEGDMTDELWGVIDLVVDSDFPDIRKAASITTFSEKGVDIRGGVTNGFIIPRERLSNGDYVTRLYVDMTVKEGKENGVTTDHSAKNQRRATKEKGSRVTETLILDRAAELFRPFRFEVKKGTQVSWWAAFRTSQSLTKSFTLKDSTSNPRVIIVGDACHSHSPRQGQGMNTSIQDSYNLAWKLAYTLFGLNAPDGGSTLLNSYEEERLPNAKRLVTFDKRMNQEGRSVDERWGEMKQFVTGCGIEYGENICVSRAEFKKEQTWTAENHLDGVILPGRRLLNCRVKRFADGIMRDIHDELRAEGRFSIVMLASDDFGVKDGRSTKIADNVCSKIIKNFPLGLVQPIILQPSLQPEFQWTDLPTSIKQEAEMNLYSASAEVYKTYGVEHTGSQAGTLIVVRPDGVVGMMAELEDAQKVVTFLKRMVRTV